MALEDVVPIQPDTQLPKNVIVFGPDADGKFVFWQNGKIETFYGSYLQLVKMLRRRERYGLVGSDIQTHDERRFN